MLFECQRTVEKSYMDRLSGFNCILTFNIFLLNRNILIYILLSNGRYNIINKELLICLASVIHA